MPSRLSDYLNAARHAHFVGRETEKSFFRKILQTDSPRFFILHIYGPGGIGKTALLREFGQIAENFGYLSIYMDTRHTEPLPEVFTTAVNQHLNVPDGQNLVEFISNNPRRILLMFDTYETLAPLDDWMRETFLPQLPANIFVVLSGRNPPKPSWRADSGWQTILETLLLRNLSPDETREYLEKRKIPVGQQSAVMQFTHGHPLALSLVAEIFAQRKELDFHPEATQDIIQTLIQNFLQKVPGPAHRAALESCALVRVTTEPVLCEMMGNPEVKELFDWLQELSFIETRPGGLFPHDLARDALTSNLHWRNPDWYVELHRRARNYYTHRINATTGLEQQRALFDLVFLHRDSPFMRPFFEWQMGGSSVPDLMRESDIPALLAMVERHEGEDSARLAAYWLEKQPENVLVPRTTDGDPAGFLLTLDLTSITSQERNADPATQAVWESLSHAPIRAAERASMFRFWMDSEAYQSVSATQSVIFIHIARHYITTPGLAYTFFPCRDEAFWTPLCNYINLVRMPDADFQVGGERYAVFGHDWRSEPPGQWLAILGEREVASGPLPSTQTPKSGSSLVVLSEPDFAKAVKDALRDINRTEAILTNPLINSRLVIQHSGAQASEMQRVKTLTNLIKDTARKLEATPKETKYLRAIHHTFFQPAANQEEAAELLNLPFSTYRRHLTRGIARITEILWNKEIGR